MSYHNVILITNNSNNTQSIFSTETNIELGFIKCIEWLQKEYIKDTQIKYIVTDNSCEIFTEKEIVKPGWVWNTNNIKREVLYTLTLLKVECPPTNIKKNSIQTQTDKVIKVNFSMNTEPVDSKTIGTSSINYDSINYFEVEIENNNSLHQDNFDPLVKDFKRLSINNFDLGTGYANHTFSPLWNTIQTEFQNELREKLASDNLGLKTTKKLKLE